MNTNALGRLFRPESIAVIGASPQPGNPRNSVLRAPLKHGFKGAIFPVSPTHDEVEGLKAYKKVGDIPVVPDVALIITPAKFVPGLIEECGIKGIKNVIVFSAGFEETEAGKDLARELASIARRFDINLIGPNCQGVWSVKHPAMLTYSPAAMNWERIDHGPIAIVSQSGALAGAICNSLQKNKLGISYMVSVGNETVFDSLDALDWIVEQPDVRVVALYIEGLDDASRIFKIAEKARANDVQIIVLKAGKSDIGQSATASHTGKIASPHAIYRDAMEQAGVISVDSLSELLSAVEVLGFLKAPRVGEGGHAGVAILTSSGGAGALLADHSSAFDVPLAQFGPETNVKLNDLLPEFARKSNPIDLTGQINTNQELINDTCRTLIRDRATEAVVVQHGSNGLYWLKKDGDVLIELAKELPVIISFVGEHFEAETKRKFLEGGVLLSYDPSTTMEALSLIYRRRALQRVEVADRRPLERKPAPGGWSEAMAFCEESKIAPAKWSVLGPGEHAASKCAQLAYPVVVKALPEDADHKTELGLVTLRVAGPDAVDRLAENYRQKMGNPSAGILVQEMLSGGVEVVLSCMRGTDFGPILTVGAGGVAVELYKDVAHLALPVTPEQVAASLKKLKLWSVLLGFRGASRADIDALISAIVKFGDRFLESEELTEVELNPVMVMPKGRGVHAVDVLLSVAAADQGHVPPSVSTEAKIAS